MAPTSFGKSWDICRTKMTTWTESCIPSTDLSVKGRTQHRTTIILKNEDEEEEKEDPRSLQKAGTKIKSEYIIT